MTKGDVITGFTSPLKLTVLIPVQREIIDQDQLVLRGILDVCPCSLKIVSSSPLKTVLGERACTVRDLISHACQRVSTKLSDRVKMSSRRDQFMKFNVHGLYYKPDAHY